MPDLRPFLDDIFSAAGGEMPFEDFMSRALYDPAHGYYTAGIRNVGGRGSDFATSATLSDGLARAIAGWIAEEIARLGWRGRVAVIEVGGGNGALAGAVLKALGWWRRRMIRYQFVEVSPVLRELQWKRLGHLATWHETMADALEATRGKALIFSNELVDAFPAKWLRWDGSKWQEIFVAFHPIQGLSEVFRNLPPGFNAADFSALALTNPQEGQRVEILPSFRRWLGGLAPHWSEGAMLTIDYGGDLADRIYDRRPGGTLRAYRRQQRIEGGGIYSRFGKQDLTTDVNFADLVKWGEELGWEKKRLGSQREFLESFGVASDAMAKDGPGAAFRVLEQRRGFDAGQPADPS